MLLLLMQQCSCSSAALVAALNDANADHGAAHGDAIYCCKAVFCQICSRGTCLTIFKKILITCGHGHRSVHGVIKQPASQYIYCIFILTCFQNILFPEVTSLAQIFHNPCWLGKVPWNITCTRGRANKNRRKDDFSERESSIRLGAYGHVWGYAVHLCGSS